MITGRSVVAYLLRFSCKYSAALLRNECACITLPTRSYRRLSESGAFTLFSFIAFNYSSTLYHTTFFGSCQEFFEIFLIFSPAKTDYKQFFPSFGQAQ